MNYKLTCWVILIGISVISISGCQKSDSSDGGAIPSASPNATSSPSPSPTLSPTPSITPALAVTPSPDPTFTPLDETLYKNDNDKLTLVKIINQLIRYTNESNKEEFKKLLSNNSGLPGPPRVKVLHAKIVSFVPPSEFDSSYFVVMKLKQQINGETVESTRTYAFTKEDGVWKLLDID